jgi:hypothetical protein
MRIIRRVGGECLDDAPAIDLGVFDAGSALSLPRMRCISSCVGV